MAHAIKPDCALGARTASLGLAFKTGSAFPDHDANGAFIGQHDSWNRRPVSAYEGIFVAIKNGVPSGKPERTF